MIEYKSVLEQEKPKQQYIEQDGYLFETPEYNRYRKAVELEFKLKKSGIPSFIINYNIKDDYIGNKESDSYKKSLYYVDNFSKFKDKVLYFYGHRGTQKTTVAYWIAKELTIKGVNVKYTTMKRLIDKLANVQFNKELEWELSEHANSDLLIIDRAFDKDQVTVYKSGYQLAFLDSFLRERIENRCNATIIISNNSIDEISLNKFNPDLEDLVRRYTESIGTVIEFKDHYTEKDNFEIEDLWE